MKRRELIMALGGAGAAAWPRAAGAQKAQRIRRIGIIMGFAEDDKVWQTYLATFRQRLQEFGWTEGDNIRFDYRFTGESTERMRTAATEVVATDEQSYRCCDYHGLGSSCNVARFFSPSRVNMKTRFCPRMTSWARQAFRASHPDSGSNMNLAPI
jgi:hypothetical protein